MDERHWWIAGKIQETFKIGGFDNPTLLEDFMTEETTLAKINRFFKAGGPCRLFFYCEKPDSGVLSTRELHVTGTLAQLKDVDLDKVNILYFLRNRVEKDVDTTRYERDIFCGELKHNTIETLTTLLADVYVPLTKAQKEWGECGPESQTNLMHSMDKFLTALNESTASMHTSKQLVSVVLFNFNMLCLLCSTGRQCEAYTVTPLEHLKDVTCFPMQGWKISGSPFDRSNWFFARRNCFRSQVIRLANCCIREWISYIITISMIRGGRSFAHTYEIEYESQWMEILWKTNNFTLTKL